MTDLLSVLGLDEVQQEVDPAHLHVQGRFPARPGQRGRPQAALPLDRGMENEAVRGPGLRGYVFQRSGSRLHIRYYSYVKKREREIWQS